MRWLPCALVFSALTLRGQQSMPVGILHGNLISWQDSSFSVRDAAGSVFTCTYDARTFIQRNQWPIAVTQLNEGEPVEVLSDRRAGGGTGGGVCYTRILSVVYKSATPARLRAPVKGKPEVWMPRGNLDFAGVVTKADASTFTLKSRAGSEITLHLRPDTRFSGNGVRLDAAEPLINKHVFVRGGLGLRGIIEAYQVIWGEIFHAP